MDTKAPPGQRRYNLCVRILSTAVLPWASLSNSHWRSLLTETRRTLEDIRGLVVYVPQDLRFSTLFCFVLNHLFHRLLVFTLHYTNALGIRTRWIMLVQEPEGSLLFWLGQTWKKTKPIFVLVLFIDVALKKENLCLWFVHSATSSLQWVIQRDNDPKQQQISERLREKRIEVLRRSRPQPDWHAVLRELCTDKYCKPQWTYATLWRRVGQNPSTVTWEADKSHRKRLLQLIAGKSDSTPSSE